MSEFSRRSSSYWELPSDFRTAPAKMDPFINSEKLIEQDRAPRYKRSGYLPTIYEDGKASGKNKSSGATAYEQDRASGKSKSSANPPPPRPGGGWVASFLTKPVEPQPTNFGLARIFSHKQLKDATNNYREEIGNGGFSKVYKGQLMNRQVAVKVLFDMANGFQQFLREVTEVSRLHHKNLITLLGCTDPKIKKKFMVVFEYAPNGTIADHLYGHLSPLTWDVRIQLSIETAEALVYLHSRDPSIIHRDVKTANILLDDGFHAKVADLGMCRLVPWDATTVTTQPQGTVGSRDPECDLYWLLTDKSDVFSFGVVLLELISGKQAIDVSRVKVNSLEDVYLYNWAVKKILNREMEQLVDPKLQYDSNHQIRKSVDSIAKLACSCSEKKREMRPPMSEVLMELKRIRDLI